MDVTPLIAPGQQIIQAYSGGQFKVSGQLYAGAVVVTPGQTYAWDVPGFEGLTAAHFTGLAQDYSPDVILLGTGKTIKIPAADLRKSFKDNGLNVEFMDTGAACRTYNVLMAEGRRVAAALLPG